jgi:hypothetical protein
MKWERVDGNEWNEDAEKRHKPVKRRRHQKFAEAARLVEERRAKQTNEEEK